LPCGQHYVPINIEANLKLLLRLFEISGNKLIENLKTFIPICQANVENSCNCGNKTVDTICYSLNYPEDLLDFLNIEKEKKLDKCSRICKSFKNCGIHRCERVCCELRGKHISNYSLQDPNGYHLCLKICGKKLSCGKHNCENYCHKGQCKPCAYIIHEGSITCNCGKTVIEAPYICGTKIECTYPCSRKRECNHPCPLKCHDGPCPPCEELTFKKCYCGKNVIDNVKCGYNGKITCNESCGEMLPCGVHFCKLICHLHTDEYDNNYVCNLTCLRQLNCGHLCKQKCHGEIDCDESACEETVYAYCKCKTLRKSFKCGELKKLNEKSENGKYLLECNDECVKAERLKNINEAFEGLKNLSEAKMKILYPNCNIDGSEEPKKEIPNKYYNNTIKMAQDKIEKIMNFEKELYNNLFKVKNKITNQNLNSNSIMMIIKSF
jgi:transcriptional repressor NF-X1